ncbi:glucosamine--fructose-6-phosphate aminotransferase (isomerizing) [Nonomuraea solani]|uniref:Glucosamine--fructose-6-phosphate aminotransferase (Isomerizing) n=1 Tax=Nonomuraea solani TaxID=1144553 RepID=A0A1H6C050_9ACTN|nr:SIS domain-containing protein [Nonomuraea solani]SEG66334.1 glucosamine--fructose-6-phosphate aminotransferase (isomerizing) [Nonomuraea solani]
MTTKMRSEIAEQPVALQATLDALLPQVREIEAMGERARQLLFIARGTSDNAAVYGRYLVESHAGRLSALAAPSIATTYKRRLDLDGVLAVAISQSGRTEEIVETLAWAKDCGAATVGITNGGPDSPLAQAADVALCTVAGEEKAVPATKTYTTQLAALAVLALGLGADVDADDLRRVPEAVEKLIAAPGDLDAVVEGLLDKPGVVVSGRGLAFSTALETALKLKEACYLHAMGLSYADLLHGPIAVVDEDTPALLVAAENSPTLQGTVALAERVVAAGAAAYTIGGGTALAQAGTAALNGPDLPEWVAPMGLIVPGQLLTEALARRLGIDPDAPRGLNKVTQTD